MYKDQAAAGINVVGIATRCRLDGPGIESLWCEIFRAVQTCPKTQPKSCTIGTGDFPSVKQPGRGAEQQSSSSAGLRIG
jgi:hypothetical protein